MDDSPSANLPPAATSARSSAPAIDVRPQHRIHLAKALALCWKGIAHRLFRSLLTLAVIVLAVAFFMSLLTEAAVTRDMARAVAVEGAAARAPEQRLAKWFGEPGDNDLAARLAASDTNACAEAAAVTTVAPTVVAALAVEARQERAILDFFAGLDAGSRAVLVHKARDRAVFAALAAFTTEGRWPDFVRALRQLHLHAPLPEDAFRDFVEHYPHYREALAAFTGQWRTAVSAFRQAALAQAGAADVAGWTAAITAGDPGLPARFQTLLAEHGFADTPAEVAVVRSGLALAAQREAIAAQLASDAGRAAWKAQFLADPDLAVKLEGLDDPRVPAVLGAAAPAPAVLAQVAARARADATLAGLEATLGARGVTLPGIGADGTPDAAGGAWLSGRQAFLMAISFVVCMVGIANAMLMAITERFREIATMKCLGATDGFILSQFLFEAAIQGAAGGVIGMAIGLVLALLKCLVLFGAHLVTAFPALAVAGSGVACVLTGILLSTLASIYPSWSASRMAPMEAMRVE